MIKNKKINKAEEYLNNWKRERADFVNYKKDEAKRMAEFIRFANESLIIELTEVIDDLIIARNNAPPGNDEWMKGLDNTMIKIEKLLEKHGVKKIKVKDTKFDPQLHEATEMEKDGEVMQEVRPGYTMHGKVIRPAKVKIIK
jgi:molecular chaperone GrpE